MRDPLRADEFRATYGWSPKRQALITELEKTLATLARCSSAYRVVVFGSILRGSTESPGDLDLIAAFVQSFDRRSCPEIDDLLFHRRGEIDYFPMAQSTLPLPPASQMVEDFNSSRRNEGSGISIPPDQWVEVLPLSHSE